MTAFNGHVILQGVAGNPMSAPYPVTGNLEEHDVDGRTVVEATLDESIEFEHLDLTGPTQVQLAYRLDTGEKHYDLTAQVAMDGSGVLTVGTFIRL